MLPQSLVLVEDEGIPVGIHHRRLRLLLLLLNALITLNTWTVQLKLLKLAPCRNVSELLSTVVKNRTISWLVGYTYCHIWRRHRTYASVNSLHLLTVYKINLKILRILVV